MIITSAKPQDGDAAVNLLFDAAGNLLTQIFGNGCPDKTRAFLKHAWTAGDGQYGYKNHWVARDGHSAVAMMCCWHDSLPANFDQASLDAVYQFFGLDGALSVIDRSKPFNAELSSPRDNEVAIGHFAVLPSYQRKGIGSQLLSFAKRYAETLHKAYLVLDVESENTSAYSFYKQAGFEQEIRNKSFIHMRLPLTD